ncbi:SsrA-binding protein SmpB [bacterium endosymbiont of Bathymodiolus sp. 5 South]|jgi:SsrA-binding protein|uniref:SsrA-binding protein SmpB n=1 Tax=bacterium endosymbiont of Bathymodiolus sp. 5 South TaxID=1181670 RepID=UPI0010B8A0BF|nr:SsrA-binding protein SmpB [bacterium endosymbiont of Bathymodiolus sp. 5 South]CAC9646017.1 tmRNA-binding protein SmpB [uncultured Gammaproteobacteria bacterium]SHN91481.1 tmRNA-binding protein SmpB [bacterium endosymbiont of Bathymodiolus sp. 5 South]SSC09112.1 tmRNA-binding protein SmpB [bacterium endosymbiont of Bathymodiolus sp. 5 South]VVH60216.1 tmRNA-binding protein SmpB [uncultured Gammaproteobacteria bacterium]VVH63640.1 tmRNA-binding protein SmpB [uncultured Gammaproteobacteria ba
MTKKNKKTNSNTIVVNKKARHDYFIEQSLEAGLCLEGWEVKSLRDNKVQIKESYVILKNNELFLFGSHISPLKYASTHVNADPTRTRKLLLHRLEINRIKDKINQKGATVVPLKLYWSKGNVKLEIGVAKGKKSHDKRQDIKEKDWKRDKHRTLKESLK